MANESAEVQAASAAAHQRAKVVAFFGSEESMLAVAQGVTDTELRELLMEALKRIEPQACYIQAVSPDDKTVVYLVDPDPGGPMPLKPYMRSYSTAEGGAVTFADERIPVRRREEWVPVTGYRSAEATAAARRGACSCGGNHSRAAGAEGATTMTTAERVTALISNARSQFEEADRAYLEGLSAERLTALETKLATDPAADAAAAAAAAAADGDAEETGTVQVSAEELQSLRAMKADRDASRAAQKRVLVGKLKTAQTTYNEARLNAMEIEQLRDIAALVGVDAPAPDVEFVAAEHTAQQTTEAVEPPKPWSLALAARKNARAN